jgi:hypothetical protein
LLRRLYFRHLPASSKRASLSLPLSAFGSDRKGELHVELPIEHHAGR